MLVAKESIHESGAQNWTDHTAPLKDLPDALVLLPSSRYQQTKPPTMPQQASNKTCE
jgi:hypothetical protein